MQVNEGEKVLHSERQFGKETRTIALSLGVDEDTAQAKYNKGALKLMLPERTAAKTTSMNIQ
jgi:HSP20 family protein